MTLLAAAVAGALSLTTPPGGTIGARPHGPAVVTRRRDALFAAVLALGGAAPAFGLDVGAAIPATVDGAQCGVQSCQDAAMARLAGLLDTTGMKANARGAASEHTPVVALKQIYGLRREAGPPHFQIIYTVPHKMVAGSPDRVQLMWLAEPSSGRVLIARAFSPADELKGPPTITADFGLGFVEGGATVVPYLYCSEHGLWKGEPFALCDAEEGNSTCDGRGTVRLRQLRSVSGGPGKKPYWPKAFGVGKLSPEAVGAEILLKGTPFVS